MLGRRPDLKEKLGTKIKKRIIASGPEGISQKILCKELGIPRMAAYRCCKRLEKEGKIRVLREGRGAKYIARSKIVMDPEIGSYIQGREAYFKIIRKRRSSPITTPRLEIDIGGLTDLEVGLFNFSNIVGAVFTYILLQTMSQGNPILHREYHRKISYRMNNTRKDQLVREWIDGFLSGILVSTPHKFRDLLYQKAGHYPASFEDRVKLFSGKKPSLSIADPEVVRLGYEALENIYPSVYYTLERISTQLPKAVEFQKGSLEAFEKSQRPSLNERLAEEKTEKQGEAKK